MDMDKIIRDAAAKLDEIYPNRPPFQNMVEVIHPEMAKYASMHISPKITNPLKGMLPFRTPCLRLVGMFCLRLVGMFYPRLDGIS